MRIRFPSFFYGWWVVGASFLIALYVGGAVFYGFTAIFEPIADELGWSYTHISLAASLRGLEMGLFAPLVGILTDRWGPRKMVFGGTILGALGLLLLTQTDSLVTFYFAFVLMAISISACTLTVLMTAVANWFRKKVGLASGITMCGFGFGGLIVPALVALIETYNWRAAVTILAMGMLVLPLSASLLLRHKPEQYGYRPDGETADSTPLVDTDTVSSQQLTEENGINARRALRTGAFWNIALTYTFHSMLIGAIVTHVMPYLSSINVSLATASLVATAIPLASIGGRITFGWLADRYSRPLITVIGFGMIGLGTFCFGLTGVAGSWLLVPFLVMFGVGYGGLNVMRPALVYQYFGRAHFGTILGVIVGVNMIGQVGGPAIAGWAYDNWGSYQSMWLLMAITPIASLIAMLFMGRTRPINKLGQGLSLS